VKPTAAAAVVVLWATSYLPGCAGMGKNKAPTTQPSTAADRALQDPSRYSPDWSDTNVVGDTAGFDRKGLKKDLGHVIMP
jgi:hypothetical protein